MNAVLAFIVVALICATIIVWLQPCLKRQITDWLNASADADDWRSVRHSEYKRQREEREA